MGTAVYIATTAGPVRVERIVGEEVPQSNVFVGRDYKPLEPLSSDYQAFVAPGGPVDVAFGPFEASSFRLDVSGPISTGNSWELAVFIAHGLAKLGRPPKLGKSMCNENRQLPTIASTYRPRNIQTKG